MKPRLREVALSMSSGLLSASGANSRTTSTRVALVQWRLYWVTSGGCGSGASSTSRRLTPTGSSKCSPHSGQQSRVTSISCRDQLLHATLDHGRPSVQECRRRFEHSRLRRPARSGTRQSPTVAYWAVYADFRIYEDVFRVILSARLSGQVALATDRSSCPSACFLAQILRPAAQAEATEKIDLLW